MTKLWQINVKLAATAYIQADTQAEAFQIAKDQFEGMPPFELSDRTVVVEGPKIEGGMFRPDMPDVSLSPAMTFHGMWDDLPPSLTEDFDEDDGTEGQDRESYSDDQDRDSYT